MDVESSPKWCTIRSVTMSSKAQKESKKIPGHLMDRLMIWIESVENDGIMETRKVRGFRDEALKGNRQGQRSIRLNKAYRVIYTIKKNLILIEEINKHDY
jgi:toxin HigB-1